MRQRQTSTIHAFCDLCYAPLVRVSRSRISLKFAIHKKPFLCEKSLGVGHVWGCHCCRGLLMKPSLAGKGTKILRKGVFRSKLHTPRGACGTLPCWEVAGERPDAADASLSSHVTTHPHKDVTAIKWQLMTRNWSQNHRDIARSVYFYSSL